MQHFSKIKFQSEETLAAAVAALTQCLLTDQQMPVQVEAAIGLQMTLRFQPRAVKILEPNVSPAGGVARPGSGPPQGH